jgi:hypothetical protein
MTYPTEAAVVAVVDAVINQEDEMDDTPQANPPGYWHREIAQAAREAAAKLIDTADRLDAEGTRIEQDALAHREPVMPYAAQVKARRRAA